MSQIDILPTMLDYAEIKTNLSFTGKSLRSIADDQFATWRDYLVVELADYKKDTTRKGRMICMDNYKYNIFSTGKEQLFDLENDPGEMNNLAGEPDLKKISDKCRQNLKQWAIKTDDYFALQILKN